MARDHTKTVQIRKVDKVAPDHRGRSVWLGKVEPVELELVSTTALQTILKSEGGKTRVEIEKLAAVKFTVVGTCGASASVSHSSRLVSG